MKIASLTLRCLRNKYVSILNAADGTNASAGGNAPRISWCPYIPEPGEGNAPEVNMIALVTVSS